MSFPERVSAISPLGEVINGTPQPKPKRASRPRREPLARSLTFFCSNPQCDHATWSEREQATHMAREFWEVAQALIRLAPESSEALKLAGGVVLADLTDDEVRKGHNEYEWLRRRGPLEEIPIILRVLSAECARRLRAGTLGPRLGPRGIRLPPRKRPPQETCGRGHLLAGDNLGVRPDGKRYCRTCTRAAQRARRKKSEAKAYANAYARRRYREDPEWRARRKASSDTEQQREKARQRTKTPEYRARHAANERARRARQRQMAP